LRPKLKPNDSFFPKQGRRTAAALRRRRTKTKFTIQEASRSLAKTQVPGHQKLTQIPPHTSREPLAKNQKQQRKQSGMPKEE
jgi:hypothetical protein